MTYLVGKHPFIKLQLFLPKDNKWSAVSCLIDTGFSGGIALPNSYKKYFPKNQFIEARYLLADNSEVVVDTTITIVNYKGKKKDIAVVFMGNTEEGLVGVEFLDQMRFCLDLKNNRVELQI